MLKLCSGATGSDEDVVGMNKDDDQKGQQVYDEAWANKIYANKDKWPMVIFTKTPEFSVQAADTFQDQFVDLIFRELDKLIPPRIALPNEGTTHKDADARLYNGYLMGANSVRREGNASASITGTTIVIDTAARLGPLSGHYDAEVKLFFIKVHPSVTVSVSDVDVRGKLSGTLEKTAQLQEFKITHVAIPRITISGLGPLNWILDAVTNFLAAALSHWIGGWIEGPIKELLQKVLNDHPLKI